MFITTSLNIPGRMPVQAFHKVTHVKNNNSTIRFTFFTFSQVGQAAKVESGSK